MGFFLWPHYPITLPSTFWKSFHQKNFQGWLKLRPPSKRVKFTTVALHKLKWWTHLEKNCEEKFWVWPQWCHLESLGAYSGALKRKCDVENLLNMAKNPTKTELLKNLQGPTLLKWTFSFSHIIPAHCKVLFRRVFYRKFFKAGWNRSPGMSKWN